MRKERILQRFQAQCSRREYCVGQIREKLGKYVAKEELNTHEAEEIIKSLKEDKFLDDSRYSSAFVRDKFRLSGWGRRKIEYYLARHGVAKEVIGEAIRENYIPDKGENILEKIILRKLKALKKEEPEAQKKMKVLRFAVGRGFDYTDVMVILKKIDMQGREI